MTDTEALRRERSIADDLDRRVDELEDAVEEFLDSYDRSPAAHGALDPLVDRLRDALESPRKESDD